MRVAVVGAGVSGLSSIKCCLDEGLEPTCFEQSKDIGGLWRYTEHVETGRPSLYLSVISNTSKEMSAFSDFPYPEDFPVFLPNARLLDYLRRYAQHFGLWKHIKFGTTVVSIQKRTNFATTGQWDVVTEADGKQTLHIFDAVMVCSGNFSEPSLPLHCFPGIERFKGQYFHSRQYKHPDVFQGKRVLVVGMGNSGVDIAVEASRVAAKVTLCTSRGAWVISRVFDHGYPWDMVINTRFMSLIINSLPGPLSRGLINYRVNQWFKHENYGLQPEKRRSSRQGGKQACVPLQIRVPNPPAMAHSGHPWADQAIRSHHACDRDASTLGDPCLQRLVLVASSVCHGEGSKREEKPSAKVWSVL
ncbi:flavin-containing monooxygenase 1 isoform X4 [Phalacrocorax aristotelis]|uniref:flavin-containing monooxygenase 1 isoform X4 n=1 Tax=Phalacrocorax aristotelis TaxID=126867 RepID=UPI003F4B1C0E